MTNKMDHFDDDQIPMSSGFFHMLSAKNKGRKHEEVAQLNVVRVDLYGCGRRDCVLLQCYA